MKKIVKTTIFALLLVGVGYGTYRFFFSEKPSIIVLQKEKVEKGDVTTEVTATGSVQPVDEVEVGTQVSGLVSKIYVDYNSQVKKGELIAELDKTTIMQRSMRCPITNRTMIGKRKCMIAKSLVRPIMSRLITNFITPRLL